MDWEGSERKVVANTLAYYVTATNKAKRFFKYRPLWYNLHLALESCTVLDW
jgi:hypothetical protein